jgi:cytochrome b561
MDDESARRVQPGEDALAGQPEPWESWETKLVLGSIGVGVFGLIILGWLVDRFILS